MTGNLLAQKGGFAETRHSAETLLKQFCLETAPIVSKWMENCLLLAKWLQISHFEAFEVVPAGFEPTTHRLEICCSIQLSYGTILVILSG
jgi:hypothetical protein